MIHPDDLAALEAGCCTRQRAAANGCTLCVPRYAAIDRIAAQLTAADKLRETAEAVCRKAPMLEEDVSPLEDAIFDYDHERAKR